MSANMGIGTGSLARGSPLVKKTVRGGQPMQMPAGAGQSTGGVVSSMDPAQMARALGTPQTTTYSGPTGRMVDGQIPRPSGMWSQTATEQPITGQDISQQVFRDVLAQKEATTQARAQILGEAEAIQTSAATAADRMRESMGQARDVETARTAEMGLALEGFGDIRGEARDMYAETQRLRDEQIARTEELRADSLEAIKTPFAMRMNSILGGMKNQFGRMTAEIDKALQRGEVDQQAAAQMKSQAKMAHLGSVGTYASQLSAEQSRVEGQLTAQINQATLASRQAALNMGLAGANLTLRTLEGLMESEAYTRASAMASARSYELGMAQLSTTIERMEVAGVELAADYRTASAALPTSMILHPALMLMADLREEDLRAATPLATLTGSRRGSTGGLGLMQSQVGGGSQGARQPQQGVGVAQQQRLQGALQGLGQFGSGQQQAGAFTGSLGVGALAG